MFSHILCGPGKQSKKNKAAEGHVGGTVSTRSWGPQCHIAIPRAASSGAAVSPHHPGMVTEGSPLQSLHHVGSRGLCVPIHIRCPMAQHRAASFRSASPIPSPVLQERPGVSASLPWAWPHPSPSGAPGGGPGCALCPIGPSGRSHALVPHCPAPWHWGRCLHWPSWGAPRAQLLAGILFSPPPTELSAVSILLRGCCTATRCPTAAASYCTTAERSTAHPPGPCRAGAGAALGSVVSPPPHVPEGRAHPVSFCERDNISASLPWGAMG